MRNVVVVLLVLVAAGVAVWLVVPNPAAEPLAPGSTDPSLDPQAGPALKGGGARAPVSRGPGTGRFRIHGRVVNAKDEPMPGMRVELMRTVHRWPGSGYASNIEFNVVRIRARARNLLAGRDQNLETLGDATADEEGGFEFRVAEGGSHYVYARPELPAAGGYASAYLIDKQRETATVTVKVFDGAPLEGRVEDSRGQPVSALVQANRPSWRAEATADSSGAFRFPAAPLGNLTLSVTLESGRQISGFSATVPTNQPVVLRVPGGSGRVSGTVSSSDGELVPGAFLTLHLKLPGEVDLDNRAMLELAATSDATGHYALSDLPSGAFTRLSAVAEGFLPESRYKGRDGWNAVTLADGASATIDITLRRGSEIHGRVTRQDGDTPIPGATVTLYFLGGKPPSETVSTTDAAGRYRFEGVDHGKFFLLASHATHYSPEIESTIAGGFGSAPREPPAQLAVRLTKADQRVERNLVLAKGAQITGTVLDPHGRPAAGARIYVKSHGLQGAGRHWGLSMMSADFPPLTESGGDGSFSIGGLAPRADWSLFARKVGYAATESGPIDLSTASAKGVTLHLAPQCVLRGHVFDAEGKPLAAQAIFIGGYTTLRGGHWRFASEADGSFEIHSLSAARINLTTRKGNESVELKIDDLKPGEVRAGLELRFGAKVQITGRVTNSRGESVRGLTLRVQRLDGPQGGQMASTDAKGNFRIDNVAPGRVQLWRYVAGGRGEKLTEPFDAPASDVAVTYDPPRKVTIEGVVLGPDGKPLELCSLRARSADGKPTPAHTVRGGAFKLEVRGEPPYAVWVTKPRLSDGTPMNARGGSTSVADPGAKVTIQLEAGVVVAGHVLDADDKGVANVVVRSSGGASASSDADGTWRLIGLAPEPVGLTAKPPAGYVAPSPFVAEPGDETVVIRLERGTRIRGRVLPPDGVTMLGGSVRALWVAQGRHAGGQASGRLKSSGAFFVQGLPPDVRVSLEVTPHQDQATSPRLAAMTVDDVLSGRTDVEIKLQLGVAVSGTVVKADGSPFTGGSVSLRGNGNGWSRIDANGKFRAEGLRPGTFDLRVSDGQGARGRAQRVTAPAEGVRVVVADTGRISGKLIDAANAATWSVRAVDPATGEDSARGSTVDVSADGAWQIGPIDKGRPWVVVARDKTGGSNQYAVSAPVEVGATDVQLTLRTGATIQGRAERDGKPVPRCWIRVQGPGWQAYTSSGEDGRFTARGVPPGRYVLTAGSYVLRIVGTRAGVEAGASSVVIDLDKPLN